MPIWLIFVLILTYILIEFINGIFFNWRLMLLSEKKYVSAGIFGAISTIMLLSAFVISAYFSVGDGDPIWWLIPITAVAMAIGNFFAALLVPSIRKWINKKTKKE